MNNKYKILIIEDEKNIRTLVATMLETNGYQAITADSCTGGKMMFESYLPDLVILDLGLPDADGMQVIQHIRKERNTPIIVLSARSDESDKVDALDFGANDYVTKPFGSGELLARVRSALRNSRFVSAESRENFRLGDLTIDYEARRVFVGEDEIRFTQTEYNIVALLSENNGKMMTYAAIIKAIWGERADDGSIKKLQVNMANIRKKLLIRPGESKYIVNELGVGYRMDE